MIGNVAKKIAEITDSKSLGWAIAQVLDLRGLSHELVNAITDKAAKQKDIIIAVMAKEFSTFLSKINISEEAQKILDGMSIDIHATLNLKDKKIKTQKVISFSSSHKKPDKTKKGR